MSDFPTIFGYVLFGISEIVSVLPIPANGIMHSLIIGLKNSLPSHATDIEMANVFVSNTPQMANVVNALKGNSSLTNAVNLLIENPEATNIIPILCKNTELQYTNTLLINNTDIINTIAKSVITEIQNKQQQQEQIAKMSSPVKVPIPTNNH